MSKASFHELNAAERACFAYGQAWGAFKLLRATGDRAGAREMLGTLRSAREMCFRRCHLCVHHMMGRCFMRGIALRSDVLAVGCAYYAELREGGEVGHG